MAATIYLIAWLWYELADQARAARILREVRREVEGFGSAFYAMIARLGRWMGFRGLLTRVEKGLIASTYRTVPMETRTAEAAKHYRFQQEYRVLGTLPGGGSTAKLFIVEPVTPRPDWPGSRFVLKYFDLRSGSRLDETMRESRSLQSARRIGAVLDYHTDGQAFYYVMPFFEGPTLAASVRSRFASLEPDQWLAERDARRLLGWYESLLQQLADFHQAGVVHKDVKPDNVIVVGSKAKLIDVGLLTDITSNFTLTTHGTEYYRDPEMVRLALAGTKVNEVDARRFDIYSAGAVLYYLIEGNFPACGPLSQFTRPVPFALQWIAAQAMADASKRYPSVEVMLADLQAFLKQAERGRMDEIKPADLPSFTGEFQPESFHRRPQPAGQPYWSVPPADTSKGRWIRGRQRPRRRRWFAGMFKLMVLALILVAIVQFAANVSHPQRVLVTNGPITVDGPGVRASVSAPPSLTMQQAMTEQLELWLRQTEMAYEAIRPAVPFDADALPIVVTANYLDTPGAFDRDATTQVYERLQALENPVICASDLRLPAGRLDEMTYADRLTPAMTAALRAAGQFEQDPLLLYVSLSSEQSARMALVSTLSRDECEIEWQLETSLYNLPAAWD
jgi:serine/threonine protein kinase